MNELSPNANALIEAVGDADGPSASDRERIRASLFSKIAAGATVGASATAFGTQTAAASAGLAGAAAKTELVAGVLALTGKGGTAAVALWFVAGGAAGVAVATPVALYTERSEPAIVAPAAAVAHPAGYSGAEPQTQRAAAAPRNDIFGADTLPRTTEATAPTRPAITPPPAIAPAAHAPPPAATPTQHPNAPAPQVNAIAANADVAIEVGLLKAAQRELASSNAAASLALLDDHAQRYPDGALKAERLGARVFALCSLGRVEQARAAAREFLRIAADSPLAPRVLSSCGGKTETPR